MNRDKLKTQDILVLALAVVTVLICLLVLIPNFSQRNEMAAIATPEPTMEPTPVPTAEPTPEPSPEPTPEPNANEEHSRAMMEAMSTEDKVWQLFLATPESVTGVSPVTISGDGMQAGLETYPVGGLVYNCENVEDETQLSDMLSGAQARSATALFLAYDNNAGSAPIALDGNLRALGFNFGLTHAEDGLLNVTAYSEGIVLDGLAAIVAPADDVSPVEAESESDSGEDATAVPFFLSAEHVAVLREQEGWNGLILTPLLTGGIEGYSDGDLAVQALAAGCDMICAPGDLAEAGQAVIDAINAGELPPERVNESVQRILFAKLEAGLIAAQAEPVAETAPETEAPTEAEAETQSESAEAPTNDAQATRS